MSFKVQGPFFKAFYLFINNKADNIIPKSRILISKVHVTVLIML